MYHVPVNEVTVPSSHALFIAVTRNVRNQRVMYAVLWSK